jgi:two-component system, chemotaxis family, CheB/CheR fusion protein
MVAGEVRLSDRAEAGHARTPMDLFFHSLAETRGSNAIGVVLSGTGADGTQGVRWIKERDGITMAQIAQ